MGIMIYKDAGTASAAAATVLASAIIQKPNSVLALSGGIMTQTVYSQLSEMTMKGVLDWSEISVFHTSEMINRKPDMPGVQNEFMKKTLYQHIGIENSRIKMPDHNARDLQAACTAYEEEILAARGLDVLLLTLGENGHLAFNSPALEFSAFTHVELLPHCTVEESARLFPDAEEPASQAVVMGMSTLLSARHIILLAVGKPVSECVSRMFSSNIAPAIPASMLQMHPNVTYMLDEDAAVNI